jgi:manganese/zinc/iron transport system substrate-binding protein
MATVEVFGMATRRQVLGMLAAMAALSGPARAADGPRVVATTGMIADAARRIGGGEVQALMGPGLDPHSYRQTRSDIAALARADLVLWHGLHLEAQMQGFLEDLATRTRVVAVADALPKDLLRGHPTYPDRFDPHVWMDPTLWSIVTLTIQQALDATAPDQTAAHAADADTFRAELAALDTYSRDVLMTVPEAARVLVTAHDAFGYFGRAYGFEVLGIQGISTESEAGLARIGEVVDVLVDRKVAAVFVESSVSDRSMRALIEGAAAKGHVVAIGGELYYDAMGPDGSYEGTYIGMIDHNVTTITRALGGQAPAQGMSGRLAAA